MIEYAQWAAIFISLINIFLSIIDKRIIRLFKSRGAINSTAGINIESLSPLYRWRLRRQRNTGFVLDSKSNVYYFNEIVHKEKQKARPIRLGVFLFIVLLIVLSIIFIK